MAIVKRNNYTTDRNLTDLALNVDYNRLGEDKIQITVSFAGSPATVTIHKGSVWECNGNRYMVMGADYTFQMDGAGHNYITFTDNPAVDFGSAAAIGTFSVEKQGYYQADNVTRTMKFYIDQTNENYYILLDNCLPDLTVMTRRFDRIKVGLAANWAGAGTIPLDTVYDDLLGSWDAVNYRFVCAEAGYYEVLFNFKTALTVTISVLVGVTTHMAIYNTGYAISGGCIIYLNSGDILTTSSSGGVNILAGESTTYFIVARLL